MPHVLQLDRRRQAARRTGRRREGEAQRALERSAEDGGRDLRDVEHRPLHRPVRRNAGEADALGVERRRPRRNPDRGPLLRRIREAEDALRRHDRRVLEREGQVRLRVEQPDHRRAPQRIDRRDRAEVDRLPVQVQGQPAVHRALGALDVEVLDADAVPRAVAADVHHAAEARDLHPVVERHAALQREAQRPHPVRRIVAVRRLDPRRRRRELELRQLPHDGRGVHRLEQRRELVRVEAPPSVRRERVRDRIDADRALHPLRDLARRVEPGVRLVHFDHAVPRRDEPVQPVRPQPEDVRPAATERHRRKVRDGRPPVLVRRFRVRGRLGLLAERRHRDRQLGDLDGVDPGRIGAARLRADDDRRTLDPGDRGPQQPRLVHVRLADPQAARRHREGHAVELDGERTGGDQRLQPFDPRRRKPHGRQAREEPRRDERRGEQQQDDAVQDPRPARAQALRAALVPRGVPEGDLRLAVLLHRGPFPG